MPDRKPNRYSTVGEMAAAADTKTAEYRYVLKYGDKFGLQLLAYDTACVLQKLTGSNVSPSGERLELNEAISAALTPEGLRDWANTEGLRWLIEEGIDHRTVSPRDVDLV